jgi:hypothetical protein
VAGTHETRGDGVGEGAALETRAIISEPDLIAAVVALHDGKMVCKAGVKSLIPLTAKCARFAKSSN